MVEPDRRQTTIWRLRFAYWLLKATNTHSEYVIHISFQGQKWLCQRASILRNTYIVCPLGVGVLVVGPISTAAIKANCTLTPQWSSVIHLQMRCTPSGVRDLC
jgi:hypothetical protein